MLQLQLFAFFNLLVKYLVSSLVTEVDWLCFFSRIISVMLNLMDFLTFDPTVAVIFIKRDKYHKTCAQHILSQQFL